MVHGVKDHAQIEGAATTTLSLLFEFASGYHVGCHLVQFFFLPHS
jgi:hypothetical protein